MRNKTYILFSLLFLLSVNVFAQSFSEILSTIEENNKDLQAGKKYAESKALEYRLGNLPDGPQLSYGYFPDNSTVVGTKEVFEISQSFQMPCYYRNKTAHSKLMMSAEELNYQVLRQNVLAEAKNLLIEYIYLLKKTSIADKRLEFANDIYSASLIRLETGDVNLLEVNKTKLHRMKVSKEANEIHSALNSVKENLIRLNGGNDVKLELENYLQERIVSLDSVLFEKIDSDPELLVSQKQFEASQKQLKVTKNMQLPAFNLGYGTETVADEKFKGVIVGVSIPLWSSKRSIQQAKIETEYYDLNTDDLTEKKIAETKILYHKVSTLKDNLDSYETVLSSVNNETLLKQSLESGEISIIDFFTEMFYYYEIYDDFLMLEKDYHQALAELYKYKL